MTRAELKQQAKDTLRGRWGKAIGILIVYGIINYVISLILGVIPGIGALIDAVITVPLSYGLVAVMMKFSRNEEVSVIDYLKIGFSNFKKAWLVVFYTIKKVWQYILAIVVVSVLMGLLMGVGIANSSTGLIVLGALLYIVIMILSIMLAIKSLYYEMAIYVAVDDENLTAAEAVDKSEAIMTNHRWELFVLSLSFMGWIFASAFTLFIGLLWVIPYMQVTMVKYYEYLNSNGTTVTTDEGPIQSNE